MKMTYYSFDKFPYISGRDIAYANLDAGLIPFIKYIPTLDNFSKVIQDKKNDHIDRETLKEVWHGQYDQLHGDTNEVRKQIDLLSSNQTFTITTAHQPSLFTGPAYFIYKIISTIKLTTLLKEKFPSNNFIPVFILGGEDHDFEEINHLHLFSKKIVWENNEGGAVGRMNTSSLGSALQELKEILGTSPNAASIFENIHGAFTRHDQYRLGMMEWIHTLIGKYGVLILNMDDVRLKRNMIPIFQEELLTQPSKDFVENTQSKLEKAGFSSQAHARDINLFFLDKGIRSRIVVNENRYEVVDTDLSYSQSEILELLEKHPEKFSPNVVLRPIYQEKTLPNLAYIGGGGELAYWMERKSQFNHFDINFPMLVRRDSCLWIERSTLKKMNKLEVDIEDFLMREDIMEKKFVEQNTEHEIYLYEEKELLKQMFQQIESKTAIIDPTLVKTVSAEGKNQIKALEHLEKRLRKAEKQKHETSLSQMRWVRERLFPQDSLQERKTNFLQFYLRLGDSFFESLLESFNPLDMRLKVIEED